MLFFFEAEAPSNPFFTQELSLAKVALHISIGPLDKIFLICEFILTIAFFICHKQSVIFKVKIVGILSFASAAQF